LRTFWECEIVSGMRIGAMLMLALGAASLCSCGGSDDPITLGEYCDSTGTAFCNRAVACQITTFNACFQDFKTGCCATDGTCGEVAMNAAGLQALESKCDAALASEDCADVTSGVAPAACLMSP
jgi:hypothetical protein